MTRFGSAKALTVWDTSPTETDFFFLSVSPGGHSDEEGPLSSSGREPLLEGTEVMRQGEYGKELGTRSSEQGLLQRLGE